MYILYFSSSRSDGIQCRWGENRSHLDAPLLEESCTQLMSTPRHSYRLTSTYKYIFELMSTLAYIALTLMQIRTMPRFFSLWLPLLQMCLGRDSRQTWSDKVGHDFLVRVPLYRRRHRRDYR